MGPKKVSRLAIGLSYIIIVLFICYLCLTVEDSAKALNDVDTKIQSQAEEVFTEDVPQTNLEATEIFYEVSETTETVEIQETIEEVAPDTSTTYSSDDLELLARLTFAEANVWYNPNVGCYEKCSDEWQMNVVCVVLNRVSSSRFPNTIRDVVYQPGQYSPTFTSNGLSKDPDERTYANVKMVLDGNYSIPENVVFQAQFLQGNGVYKQIGNTYFCYID